MVDDDDEADPVDPDCALMGKVLSPTVLHTNTISSAMRPAWGNPKGLLIHPVGDNLFVAEFINKMDRDRVLEGSPWMVGKHVVLLKFFDPNVHPLQVEFKTLSIWARIMALPLRLMKAKPGMEFVKPIGRIERVESNVEGRCSGAFMCARA
ncbi:hypothetical protein VPH35_083911 [Triticum aestivum]